MLIYKNIIINYYYNIKMNRFQLVLFIIYKMAIHNRKIFKISDLNLKYKGNTARNSCVA